MPSQKTVKQQIEAMRVALTEMEKTLTPEDLEATADVPPIVDMLEYTKWLKSRGSIGDNFYNTIQYHLRRQVVLIGGQYDMPNGLIIQLTDDVGLQILADYNKYTAGKNEGKPVLDEDFRVDLDLQFVKMPDKSWLSDPIDPPEGFQYHPYHEESSV